MEYLRERDFGNKKGGLVTSNNEPFKSTIFDGTITFFVNRYMDENYFSVLNGIVSNWRIL